MTLDAFRDATAAEPGTAYLDHAATGVLAAPVLEAATGFLERRAGRVPGRSPNDYPADLARIERARARAARLMNAPVEGVEVVANTSAGLNVLAQGLDWAPGDRVAVAACEFPANRLPWLALRSRGVEVDGLETAAELVTPAAVDRAIRPRTRVVAVSWVQFLSGARADLAGIADVCRARGVLLAVDAIQGLGALDLDVAAVRPDLVAAGGHKWLGSMQGAGVVYVAPGLLGRLEPVRGWLNGPVDWDDFEATGLDLHADATRLRSGTLPTAQVYALDAALGMRLALGMETVETAVLDHARTLADGLAALGLRRVGPPGPPRSGIVAVAADAPEALFAHLAARGVAVSLRSRLVRFAAHASTRPNAVAQALDAAAEFVAEVAPARTLVAVP